MVGHTHADVDQSFSCLSKYLQKNSSFTMEGDNNTDSCILQCISNCTVY